jgi:ABC-2 type transport system ATP-binding protein
MTSSARPHALDPDTIAVTGLRKRHRGTEVLHGIELIARPGRVTAFIGPNGAGKSSTLRILLGLDSADAGTATFGGQRYAEIDRPLTRVGALLDGVGGAKSRRVRTHLRIVAESNAIRSDRVAEVLHEVGMTHRAGARLGTLSLGEGQRVGLAVALLGDPQFLVLDEPTNGLDPAGIRWLRELVVGRARSGATVLLSSHLLHEVQAVADDVVAISHGSVVLSDAVESATAQISSLEDLFFALTEGGA